LKGEREDIRALEEDGRVVTDQEEIRKMVQEHLKKLGQGQLEQGLDMGDKGDNLSEEANKVWNQKGVDGVESEGSPKDELMREITLNELRLVIRTLKNNTSCGEDGIPNEFVKYGGSRLHRALITLFNLFLKIKGTPQEWNKERISMIYKGGKKNLLTNYRTLALSNVVDKIFCRVLARRLQMVAEREGWLPEAQAAFRKNRGTEDHLFTIMGIVERAKKDGRSLLLGFVDLEKAYDNVLRDHLWEKLKQMGVGDDFIAILKSLYNEHLRRARVAGGTTDWVRCYKGLRQGCPLSALLFVLLLAYAPGGIAMCAKGVEVMGCSIQAMFYADDIVLLAESEEDMQLELGALTELLRGTGLRINYKKSNIMKMGKNVGSEVEWEIVDRNMNSEGIIKEINQYKYLGLTLGRSTGFKQHVQDKVSKGRQRVGMVKAKTAASEDRMRTTIALWQMSVKMELLYGAEVLTYPKCVLNKLEGLQTQAAKWAMQASRTGSASGIKGELAWLPLSFEADIRKLCLWVKIENMGENRWPKKVLQMMKQSKAKYKWYEEVLECSKKYNVSEQDGNCKEWRKKIRNKVNKVAWEDWQKYVNTNQRLRLYKVDTLGEPAKYIGKIGQGEWICKARVYDKYAILGRNEMQVCTVCGLKMQEEIEHILLECEKLESSEHWTSWVEDLKKICPDNTGLIAMVMNTRNAELQEEIGVKVGKWVKCRSQMEKLSKSRT
jgi:hypothetical protein